MSDFENIPEELKQRDQWLMWDASADTPRRPHWRGDFGISWSDPDDWHTFEEAVDAAAERDSWGIGYVNAADNDDHVRGMVGSIDIDGVAEEPHGAPKDWLPSLQPFFDRDAYEEWSPSAEGLRIPIVGMETPEWWSDQHFSDEEHEGVEVLTNKFSTYTGDELRGCGDEVAEYGEWVDEWLREVYKSITGEDPVDERQAEIADSVTDEGSDTPDEEWFTEEVAEDALDHIDPDSTYSVWRDVGMALTNKFGSRGESMFESWSRRGSKWDSDAKEQAGRIESDAGDYQYDAGTIIHYAKEGGWDASAAAREQLGGRPDGGATAAAGGDAPGPETTESTDSPDSPGSTDWSLTPRGVLLKAIDDPLSSLQYDEDGRVNGSVEDLRTHKLAHYTWDLAKETDNDNILALRNGPIYSYDDGVWADRDQQRLRDIGSTALRSEYRKSVRDELEERVRTDRDKHPDELGAPDGTIATEGGLLDLLRRDTVPLEPEHYATSKIPVEPDADADCPEWRSFLDDSIDDDDARQRLQEYAGYCLWHHQQQFGKALFLVGPTDSGKGTALTAIRNVLGGENVAAESLRNLVDSRWGKASLVGNIVNMRNEVSPQGLKNVEQFKELTGGEDEVDAEFKGQDKFKFVVTQKFLFATNQMPSVENADEAFYNRLLFVEFPHTVPAQEQDKQLDAKLEDERAGILNWMLDGLQRLLKQGHFTGERSIGGKKELCDAFGGVIDRFTHNCLMVSGDEDDVVAKRDLEELAKRYAESIDKEPEWDKMSGFTQSMSQQIGISQGQKRLGGENTRVFRGVRIKPEIVYQFNAEPRAVTAGDNDSRNAGLGDYGDEVRPGYDMHDDESDDSATDESDDDEERSRNSRTGGSYVQAVTETVAEASEPVGVAYIIQHTEGGAEQLREAIDVAEQNGRIVDHGDDEYTA